MYFLVLTFSSCYLAVLPGYLAVQTGPEVGPKGRTQAEIGDPLRDTRHQWRYGAANQQLPACLHVMAAG